MLKKKRSSWYLSPIFGRYEHYWTKCVSQLHQHGWSKYCKNNLSIVGAFLSPWERNPGRWPDILTDRKCKHIIILLIENFNFKTVKTAFMRMEQTKLSYLNVNSQWPEYTCENLVLKICFLFVNPFNFSDNKNWFIIFVRPTLHDYMALHLAWLHGRWIWLPLI